MKTTIDLPDDLMRKIKLRAIDEGRKLKDLIADLLIAGLSSRIPGTGEDEATVPKKLPQIKVRPVPMPRGPKLTTQQWCDWIKNADVQLEVDRHEKGSGRQRVARADA